MNLFAAFNSDGYKLGHGDMYANGTTKVYSNLTPRHDKIRRASSTKYYDGKLVWVGGQGAFMEMHEAWQKFFAMDEDIAVGRFKTLVDNYLGEGVVCEKRLRQLHKLGYLPLEIKSLDEGTKVKMGIPVFTITNTVDHAFWLVNFLETVLSSLTWKTATNATIAGEYKAMLKDFAERTGTALDAIAFQAHDFSARGMSGPEDAARSGFGHICQFLGTDTLGSLVYAQDYYNAAGFIAASVPATEHAVSSNNIISIEEALLAETYEFHNDEQRAIFNKMNEDGHPLRLVAEAMFMYELIVVKFPVGIVSYVADTYDFWAVVNIVVPYLKDVILRRKASATTPGKLVLRPDSGDPVKVVCGYKVADYYDVADDKDEYADFDGVVKYEGKYYTFEIGYEYGYYGEGWANEIALLEEIPEWEVKGAVECLYDIFGGTETATGHKLLDEHIGLIYGDSITPQRCLAILEGLEEKGFASGNMVFGVGSYTYQCNTRDTFGFAVKATYSVVNGEGVAIFKDPKTDSKKKSAKGLLFVGKDSNGDYELVDNVSPEMEADENNFLTLRYKDGNFFNLTSLEEIRQRLA